MWSDGFVGDLKANNTTQLMNEIYKLIINYKAEQQLFALQNLMNYSLTEYQFATLIGISKLYN